MKIIKSYPNLHANSVLEAISQKVFRNHLPVEWLVDKPADFGIDLNVTPVLEGNVVGLNFSVQLKAQKDIKGKLETRLKKTTLNYLFTRLEPIMIVLFDEKSNVAWWKWLLPSDFDLSKEVATYAVRFNNKQNLCAIDWLEVCEFIQRLFKVKNRLLTSLEYDMYNTASEYEAKAWSHYYSRNLEEAALYFKRLIKKEHNPMWLLALAQCQYQVHDYSNAIVSINKALEKYKDDIILLTKGCILAEDGIRNGNLRKLSEAEKIFETLYNKDPNAVHAFNYANAISMLRKYEKAEELYKQAIKLDPNYAEAWKNLGQIYFDQRKHKLEMQCYNKALAINPGLFEAKISKAITDGFIYEKYEHSIESILECVTENESILIEFHLIHYWLGLFYYKICNVKEALRWMNKGLNNKPGNAQLINLKAQVLFEVVDEHPYLLNDAVVFFEENYALNNDDPVNFFYLCKCIEKQGDKMKMYTMVKAWLDSRQFTKAFSDIDENELTPTQGLALIRHWTLIESYIVRYPLEKLKTEFQFSGIKKFERFLKLFEIKRMVFVAGVEELFGKFSKDKERRDGITQLYKDSFLQISPEYACNLITASKNDHEAIAKQLSEVPVMLSNLLFVECARCVGFVAGCLDPKKDKNLIAENIDAGLMTETILYYIEIFYRHLGLPMG